MTLLKEDILADLDKKRLKAIISKFDTARVLVIGDIILDEYLLGKPERISREAPVLVLNYINSKYSLGGAANAAQNISSYGAGSRLMGMAGSDDAKNQLENLAEEQGVDLYLCLDEERGTTVKTRIVSSSNKDQANGTIFQQQILRVDRQNRSEINSEAQEFFLDELKKQLSDLDLIVFSDYESGTLSKSFVQEVIKLAKGSEVKVLVDSPGDFDKYSGAFILTPNQPDVEKVVGFQIKTADDIKKAAQNITALSCSAHVLITRGANGMALCSEQEASAPCKILEIPAFNLSEVFDVTGAGDTVSGTIATALAVGASPFEASLLGNLAASLVVKKYGTATVSKDELISALEIL